MCQNTLARRTEFGEGFTMPNLRNMRQFYLTFPKRYALRSELNWTHYRILMRVENDDARDLLGWSVTQGIVNL